MRSAVELSSALVNGLGTAAWVAVPDIASTRRARAALRTGILGATVTAFVLAERHGRTDVEELDGEEADGEEPDGRPWLTVGAAAALSVITHVLVTRGVDAGADRLRRRGVRHPRTLLGAALGTVVAIGELAAPDRR
ncbi:hypothetical protein [Nocardioides sp. L-11A]|uniref:hypothetical protein n=1 Tax=Nocardioides sp. L-11A TaxID=3043848 RepID=UPI00249C9AF8|nr:hypothetical protein QJ852_21350 [Nocardioides sp. L-11A]